MNKKGYLFLLPVLLLLVLGSLNIYNKITWKEPSDGVVWEKRPSGLTAIKVDINGPAYLAGIKKGDILYSIHHSLPKEKTLITNKIDLIKNLWIARSSGQKIIYEINRQGELMYPSMSLIQKGANLIYFYLALIGLITLIICLIVFFNTKKPFSIPHTFFYFLSLFLYSFYTFSFTGELDFLDSVFYWLDKIAFLGFPPLLLHFFLIFPKHKKFLKVRPSRVFLFYFPGFVLLLVKIGFHLPYFKNLDNALILSIYGMTGKLDLLHFAVFTLATLATILHSYLKFPSLLVKKQLQVIVYGLSFGVIPFTLFYVIPFILGQAPSQVAELTILLQAFIPLTFAYSISRYKLMDLEVILKKSATFVFSYFVIACMYFIVSSQTKIFSEYRMNAFILGILAITLSATLFSPLRKLFQTLFDRVFYKKSYKYRRTLLSISKELSRERNLQNLSQSLLELIANALSLQNIALLLPLENETNAFSILSYKGESSSLPAKILFDPQLYQSLQEKDSLSLYSLGDKKEFHKKFENLSALSFNHFLPLKVEAKLIGCLAMSNKIDSSFFTSEDWELLTTISSPVALALENAYLYSQASIRTMELERLKDYSENIIESLTVGVAVLDQKGRIIGWNRVLEEAFAKKKFNVLGLNLIDVLGPEDFSSLFPSDTQQDYHLLSEIPLELPSGEKRIFDVAKTPLLDNHLNPYGTIIVFEDITEKIQLQQQLMTSEKLASIGLLSAGVAHEINTPLTGISSYVQMLQKKITDTHFAQILEKIETQTERVSRIINNLLNFARNPSDFSFHRVNLNENLQEIISLIDYKLKAINIRMELNLNPVKPIWAQGERLQQVFINIILNAIDAMPDGGTLRIDLQESDSEAVIRIADTGTGIKEQHLLHIFDPFFTTKGIGKGTGLGLSISYAIVKEHEGRINVESEMGKGSCFIIAIPVNLDLRRMNQKSHPPTSLKKVETTK
ncbi:MAG: ATP-binding protein [Candidatus Aminicenantales bacterium]